MSTISASLFSSITKVTRAEALKVIHCLPTNSTYQLIGKLIFGTGMRVNECRSLRVKDLDFARSLIVIRDGKGEQNRITMLPESLVIPLNEHLVRVSQLHERDLSQGNGCVDLPYALTEKYPNANITLGWQYLFPSAGLSTDPRTTDKNRIVLYRHHLHDTALQRAIAKAAKMAGMVKPVGPHTFRHYAEFRTMPSSRLRSPFQRVFVREYSA